MKGWWRLHEDDFMAPEMAKASSSRVHGFFIPKRVGWIVP
jgi:hypothetical protein